MVVDQYGHAANGTAMSACNLAGALRLCGHEVSMVGMGGEGEGKFALPELFLPLATAIAHREGTAFAKPVEEVLCRAFAGADVVHFYMPFLPLGIVGKRIADRMGLPSTAAFHVQPENITYNCGLAHSEAAADFLYDFLGRHVYNKFSHLHCPSSFIAGELKKHGYTAKLHVISNGAADCFTYERNKKPPALEGKFCILMIGRLSKEKRQDVLIRAVALSRHSAEIQIFFAGDGPKKEAWRRLGKKLPNPPSFGFYGREELRQLMSVCDLYVHPADVEIEAIACIEAFSSGLVPVISDSRLSATGQFALDERSLFAAGDAENLAEKIDYWIEHPAERKEAERRYGEYGKRYRLPRCAARMETMFYEAIEEEKNGEVIRCCKAGTGRAG